MSILNYSTPSEITGCLKKKPQRGKEYEHWRLGWKVLSNGKDNS